MTMPLPLYWLDAFTDRPFSGNPAAVVPLENWLDDAVMQRIAFEHGLSETAFFVRTGSARFHLRWFAPTIEVDLCGHATLATAHAIFHQLGQSGDAITFDTRSGPLVVTRRDDGKFTLDFPSRPAAPIPRAALPDALARCLLPAAPVAWAKVATHAYYLAVFAHADEVRGLRPDFSLLATLGDTRLIATAPGTDSDFVSRFFAPGAGVPEDPVTGSAHCTLTPYWSERLGKTRLHARQLSARGGELWCELAAGRVRLTGQAVLYLRGEILV